MKLSTVQKKLLNRLKTDPLNFIKVNGSPTFTYTENATNQTVNIRTFRTLKYGKFIRQIRIGPQRHFPDGRINNLRITCIIYTYNEKEA